MTPATDGSAADGPEEHPSSTKELVTDHLESIGLVRATTQAQREALLDRVGERGPVEQDIVAEVAAAHRELLADPTAFPEAHGAVLRCLETLERNGGRPPVIHGLGPLGPVAAALVAMIARAIVRAYLSVIVGRLVTVYGFRSAAAPSGSPERAMLVRAHREMRVIAADLRGSGRGIVALLAGGVVIGAASSMALAVARAAARDLLVAALVVAVLVGLLLAFSWCSLMAAAVARRRIRLSVEVDAGRLFAVIGGCGAPPRDHAVELALGASALMAIAWILVPIGISIAVAGGLWR